MQKIMVSLFASAVRPLMWDDLLNSLLSTSVSNEIIFSGFNKMKETEYFTNKYPSLRYIHTGKTKPAQNYEIARRNCTGETVVWIADDCEFPNDVIGKAYKYWKSQNNDKLILSIQTWESGYLCPEGEFCDMTQHRFYSCDNRSPIMAPIALMSRDFLEKLGGLDRRYICGQYENDIVMRAYKVGARVEIFGDKECYVKIDHLKKSIDIGESTNQNNFIERPFAKGYAQDRKILEDTWSYFDQAIAFKRLESGERPPRLMEMRKEPLTPFEPYSEDISLIRSEGANLSEIWN